MKRSLVLFTLFLSSILLNSCIDKCKDIHCEFGDCEEGICICDDGYMGDLCDVRRSSIFDGTWRGPFACVNQTEEVILVIEEDPVDLRKLSMNTLGLSLSFNGLTFGLDGNKLSAMLNENYTSFTIDTQRVTIPIPNTPGVSVDVYGNGILASDNSLTFLINIENSDFNAFFTCAGTLEKS